jgi:uncharacterized protein (DUF433 family)
MNLEIINVDKDILNGTPVFRGTRVPVESLFMHLEKGITIDEFLDDFPSVTKEQALGALEVAGQMFSPVNVKKLYEITAR